VKFGAEMDEKSRKHQFIIF